MKQNMIPLPVPTPVTSSVTVLQFKGHLRLDPDPLADIYASSGEDAAEDIVCRTLADLAHRLGDLRTMHQSCAFDKMTMPVRRVAAIAGQIGLIEVTIAAENVAHAAVQNDGIAVEATFSRLERCFDLAMTEVWNFHPQN